MGDISKASTHLPTKNKLKKFLNPWSLPFSLSGNLFIWEKFNFIYLPYLLSMSYKKVGQRGWSPDNEWVSDILDVKQHFPYRHWTSVTPPFPSWMLNNVFLKAIEPYVTLITFRSSFLYLNFASCRASHLFLFLCHWKFLYRVGSLKFCCVKSYSWIGLSSRKPLTFASVSFFLI